MGTTYRQDGMRNVERGKGVISGCLLSRSGASTVSMAAGRVRFGMTQAQVDAANGEHFNKPGTEKAVSSATLSTAALADGTYVVYLKTDGTLAVTPESAPALTKGPMINLNIPGLSVSPNAQLLDTPSIRLGTVKVTTNDFADTDLSHAARESL